MKLRFALVLISALSLPSACIASSFSPARLREIDVTIQRAIDEHRIVGGLFWLERKGEVYSTIYGERAVVPRSEAITFDTIFDVASLTKVIATTPAVMLLVEEGRLDLDAPISRYIPLFTGDGRDAITPRHLLTHTSGLRPVLTETDWTGYERGLQLTLAEKPLHTPGSTFVYSDLNFILLGEIVQRLGGEPLHQFVRRRIFQPLGMTDTGFLPPLSKRSRIAPTEKTADEGILRGVVHDPTARRMGGVAGHAGLFSTAKDLARYARMILDGGRLGNVRLMKPATVAMMTSVQTAEQVVYRRALGWDIDSTYSRPRGKTFPLGSFGHTGWTGSFLWIDPFSQTFYLFLSNRVHPEGTGSVVELQKVLGTLAAETIMEIDFTAVPGAIEPRPKFETLNGIDALVTQSFAPLAGLRVGLITNQTGRDRNGRSTIDLLYAAPAVQLKALFSPEHGLRGERDGKIGDDKDSKTGLPIYSLYGERRKPDAGQLAGLDALVFDIQDIGARFYTYISTMGLAMDAATEAGIKFIVLDRINPINGVAVEGPVLAGETSFTAHHPIVIRHGMTAGELAQMFRDEKKLQLDLTVIKLEKWNRLLWQDETAIPWVNPSPNMRRLDAAALYPGVALLETAELSVGRGTATPFEIAGAPYIDDQAFATALEAAVLPGVRFAPVQFTPDASVFKGELCRGVRMRITNRDALNAVDLGITMAQILHRMYPRHFTLAKVNQLLRHPPTIEAIRRGESLPAIRQLWSASHADFLKRREKYLLY